MRKVVRVALMDLEHIPAHRRMATISDLYGRGWTSFAASSQGMMVQAIAASRGVLHVPFVRDLGFGFRSVRVQDLFPRPKAEPKSQVLLVTGCRRTRPSKLHMLQGT